MIHQITVYCDDPTHGSREVNICDFMRYPDDPPEMPWRFDNTSVMGDHGKVTDGIATYYLPVAPGRAGKVARVEGETLVLPCPCKQRVHIGRDKIFRILEAVAAAPATPAELETGKRRVSLGFVRRAASRV